MDVVRVGRIVRPHGNRGEVVVESETDFGETRFQPGATLVSMRDGRIGTLRVRSSRPYGGRWVIGFDDTASIDAAEALRGTVLGIAADDVTPLEPGRYYAHDLVGCRVVTVAGDAVGTVLRVDFGAGPPLLAVEGGSGEVWIPLAETICRQVDVAGRRIVIEPPAGLLDLNEPRRKG
jgi:16S rRNA processing protein RimM